MTAKYLTGVLVVCLLANLCDVIVGGASSHFNVPSSTKKCPHLWTEYEDNCFLMYAIPATRADAKTECEDMQDGTLVNILTSRDNDFLVDYWNEISPQTERIWIGLKRDSSDRDKFYWDNDIGIQFTDWNVGEPNDIVTGREDCVEFIKGEGWNDRDCYDRKYPFVCMKPRV